MLRSYEGGWGGRVLETRAWPRTKGFSVIKVITQRKHLLHSSMHIGS